MPEPVLTRARAAAHETLFTKLDALTRQAEAIAARRPAAAVPAETRAAAEALLYDAQLVLKLSHPKRRRLWGRGLPAAAGTFAGLATQLGQALAGLDAFEAAHSRWNTDLKCFAWQLDGEPLPVRRLRPELLLAAGSERESREADMMRRKIVARFEERYDEGFEAGLKAARETPRSAPPSASATSEIQKT